MLGSVLWRIVQGLRNRHVVRRRTTTHMVAGYPRWTLGALQPLNQFCPVRCWGVVIMVVRSKRGARPWAVWDWAFAKIGAKRLFRKAAQPGGRWQLDINRLRVKRLRMAVLKVNLKDGHGREVVRTTAETAVLSTRTSQRLQTVASTR
jgi:hypothetical protein